MKLSHTHRGRVIFLLFFCTGCYFKNVMSFGIPGAMAKNKCTPQATHTWAARKMGSCRKTSTQGPTGDVGPQQRQPATGDESNNLRYMPLNSNIAVRKYQSPRGFLTKLTYVNIPPRRYGRLRGTLSWMCYSDVPPWVDRFAGLVDTPRGIEKAGAFESTLRYISYVTIQKILIYVPPHQATFGSTRKHDNEIV